MERSLSGTSQVTLSRSTCSRQGSCYSLSASLPDSSDSLLRFSRAPAANPSCNASSSLGPLPSRSLASAGQLTGASSTFVHSLRHR